MQNLVKDHLEIHFAFLGLKVALNTHIQTELLPPTNVIELIEFSLFLPASLHAVLTKQNT